MKTEPNHPAANAGKATNGQHYMTSDICYLENAELLTGLTKREYISIQVLNGLISAWGEHDVTDYNDLAHDAVMAADALIDALNQ